MLYSGEQILSFKSCLVFYAGDSLSRVPNMLACNSMKETKFVTGIELTLCRVYRIAFRLYPNLSELFHHNVESLYVFCDELELLHANRTV